MQAACGNIPPALWWISVIVAVKTGMIVTADAAGLSWLLSSS